MNVADIVVRAPEVLPENPWMRLPGETTKAYSWFCEYRNMPARVRSKAELAKQHSRSVATFNRWAVLWKWGERVESWDLMLEQQDRESILEGVHQAGVMRVRVLVDGLELIHARLTGREGTVNTETGEVTGRVNAIDPGLLDAKDLSALGNFLSKLHVAADEAAGTKPLAEQEVNVKLSFDLEGLQGVGHRAVQAEILPPASREISPAEPDAA